MTTIDPKTLPHAESYSAKRLPKSGVRKRCFAPALGLWRTHARLPAGMLAAILLASIHTAAIAQSTNSLPDEPGKAWAEIARAGHVAKTSAERIAVASKCREFLLRFPRNEHTLEARRVEIRFLREGGAAQTEREGAYEDAVQDTSLPESIRFEFRYEQLQLRPRRSIEHYAADLLTLADDFPNYARAYQVLLTFALENDLEISKKLAQRVVDSPQAPQRMKSRARQVVDGTIFIPGRALGKPLELRFTAVDGREVDLAKLKGKVVAIDFWASWAASRSHMEALKQYYADYPSRFEVIGINLDSSKADFISATNEMRLPWPQYYDGKGWGNELGLRFSITGIPRTWLVDQEGNLRNTGVVEMDKSITQMLGIVPDWGIDQPLALRFTAVDGREVDLANMKGKVVLLVFFSSQMPPAQATMTALGAYSANEQSRVEVVGISLDENKDRLLSWAKTNQADWPQYFDRKGWQNRLAGRFQVRAVPQIWIVDRQGFLRGTFLSAGSPETISKRVAALLEK